MRFSLLIAFLLFSAHIAIAQKNKENAKAAAFDAYIQQVLPRWQTPGISVVVVKDGNIVFKKAYGVRELGKPQPYTTATLSACASTTKAMTAVCMGMLVDAGKVKWSDKVSSILPGFKIASPYVSAEITVKDLFTHNTGLGNADFLWVSNYPREEILRRMQFMEPAYSLRGGFVYQNLMYVTAGEVIHQLSGKTWDAFITDSIFNLVGMHSTYADHAVIAADADMATPHYRDRDTIKPIGYLYTNNIGAAGGVWSCADDMAKWLQCLLDSTNIHGRRLLKPETFAAMFTPQVIAPLDMYPTMEIIQPHWFTYGLGWFQHDYRGKMLQFHTGSLAGLTAIAGMVPDAHTGVYVFGNLDHAELRHALMYKAIDVWAFNDNSHDWSNTLFQLYKAEEDTARKEEAAQLAKRVLNTRPGLPLQAYTGKFSNKVLASISVVLKDNSLQIDLPGNRILSLQHWQYDVFRGLYTPWWAGTAWVQFLPDKEGRVAALRINDAEYKKME